MAKRLSSATPAQPLRWMAFIVLLTTIVNVNITALRPVSPIRRMGSAASHPPMPTTVIRGDGRSLSVALESSKRSGGDNVVPVPTNRLANDSNAINNDRKVDELLELLETVPSNRPTPRSLTDTILEAVRDLEEDCPTEDRFVLSELSGSWELLWTAQDRSSQQFLEGGWANRLINPLENQSYSNNPFVATNGRANPVLPRELQDALERTGILEATSSSSSDGSTTTGAAPPIRSSQGIDLRRKRVRNVVNVQIRKSFSVRGSLVVDVAFEANPDDQRRIDVKFDACRLIVQNPKVDQKFPLGVLGPRGWLRTGYIDDRIRITRGHKGSVFILSRTRKNKATNDEKN